MFSRAIDNPQTLYATTIFLSAFLLFMIQPLVGRLLLPWFGGASTVWTTSLLFFTAMLFVGYAYAYGISRLAYERQGRVHLFVLGIGSALFILSLIVFRAAYPPLDWTAATPLSPASLVLLALLSMIGLPYFLLATTGPLLQYWFGVSEAREPYRFYILSNIGSFIALGSYPFVLEPLLPLSKQTAAWDAGFLVFTALYALVAYRFFIAARTQALPGKENTRDDSVIRLGLRMRWVTYAALPAALMAGTTTALTQTIAPMPFLWIVPLALYLLSFIVAFRGWGGGGLNAAAVVVLAISTLSIMGYEYGAVTRQIFVYLAFFFAASLYSHARLYAARPSPPHAAFFYLLIALGGALGTLLIAIVAPLSFRDWFEFPLGVLITLLIALALFPTMRYVRDAYARHVTVWRTLALFTAALLGVYHIRTVDDSEYLLRSRNFYGVVKVYEGYGARALYHGTTLHGKQFTDEMRALQPMTYYGAGSGVGRAVLYKALTKSPHQELSIGAIGLGTGSLAAYCPGTEQFIFYEIDARIEDVARTYFTYLGNCPQSEVRIGDGRKLLEAEFARNEQQQFDVFAIDAFSDDTIPAHLLTKEAVALYLAHLADDGLLAIHTSNRYLELAPVVVRIAQELGLAHLVVNDSPEEDDTGLTSSQWVVLARDKSVFAQSTFSDVGAYADKPAPLWTDDYMNILATLSLPALYTAE